MSVDGLGTVSCRFLFEKFYAGRGTGPAGKILQGATIGAKDLKHFAGLHLVDGQLRLDDGHGTTQPARIQSFTDANGLFQSKASSRLLISVGQGTDVASEFEFGRFILRGDEQAGVDSLDVDVLWRKYRQMAEHVVDKRRFAIGQPL